jgi:hypothetical protein
MVMKHFKLQTEKDEISERMNAEMFTLKFHYNEIERAVFPVNDHLYSYFSPGAEVTESV